jgi:dynactin 1
VPPIRDHGYEEMKIRLRVLESKRTDEADKVRAMESKLREAEEVSSTVVVLQNKLATLQTELRHLRLSSKQLESSNAELELKLVELNDQLEMVTLDKEFAEEKGESLEAELEAEKEKVVGLEVEVEVLREENAEYDKPPDAASGERSSMAFIQLEKHNNRLKEALTRYVCFIGSALFSV